MTSCSRSMLTCTRPPAASRASCPGRSAGTSRASAARPMCRFTVSLTLAEYEALRVGGPPVLAPGHGVARLESGAVDCARPERQAGDRDRRLVRHRQGDGAPRSQPPACASRAARGGSSGSRPRSRSSSTSPKPRAASASSAEAVERLGGLDILVNNAGLALGRAPFDESSEEDEARRLRRQRHRARPDDAALPAALRATGVTSSTWARSRAARRTRTARRTSRRSSPSAASPTRCARICSAGRSGSRPSTRGSSRRSSRSSASRATRRRRPRSIDGVDALQPEDIAECILFALTRPWHVNVDEIVVKARNQSSGGRILRDE